MNSLRGESRPGVMLTPPKNVFPQSDLGSMVTTDFIYDICHLCTRSRTDRIKAISRGSLTGVVGGGGQTSDNDFRNSCGKHFGSSSLRFVSADKSFSTCMFYLFQIQTTSCF